MLSIQKYKKADLRKPFGSRTDMYKKPQDIHFSRLSVSNLPKVSFLLIIPKTIADAYTGAASKIARTAGVSRHKFKQHMFSVINTRGTQHNLT